MYQYLLLILWVSGWGDLFASIALFLGEDFRICRFSFCMCIECCDGHYDCPHESKLMHLLSFDWICLVSKGSHIFSHSTFDDFWEDVSFNPRFLCMITEFHSSNIVGASWCVLVCLWLNRLPLIINMTCQLCFLNGGLMPCICFWQTQLNCHTICEYIATHLSNTAELPSKNQLTHWSPPCLWASNHVWHHLCVVSQSDSVSDLVAEL